MTLSVIDRSDLIRTIDDDDNIEVDDDSSEDEDVAQPKKNKAARQAKKDFEPEFTFVSSQKEYMKDTWNDIAKYVKKKARTNLDEKIAKIRKERKDTKPDGKEIVVSDSDESSEEELSEDELVEVENETDDVINVLMPVVQLYSVNIILVSLENKFNIYPVFN